MTQVCKCCTHEDRLDIDRELVRGVSRAEIARKFGVSYGSVEYHFNNHISRQMATHEGVLREQNGMDVLSELQGLIKKTDRILTKAERNDHNGLALAAIKELRNHYALISSIQAFVMEQHNKETRVDDPRWEEFLVWKKQQEYFEEHEEEWVATLDDEEKEFLFRINKKQLEALPSRTRMQRTR